jgi:hypothetical protein
VKTAVAALPRLRIGKVHRGGLHLRRPDSPEVRVRFCMVGRRGRGLAVSQQTAQGTRKADAPVVGILYGTVGTWKQVAGAFLWYLVSPCRFVVFWLCACSMTGGTQDASPLVSISRRELPVLGVRVPAAGAGARHTCLGFESPRLVQERGTATGRVRLPEDDEAARRARYVRGCLAVRSALEEAPAGPASQAEHLEVAGGREPHHPKSPTTRDTPHAETGSMVC